MKKPLLFLIIAMIVCWGCGSDDDGPSSPCPEDVSLGAFSLAAASEAFVPYGPADERVVFVDTLGEEQPFRIAARDQGVVFGGLLSRPCPEDSAFQVRYEWQNSFRYWELTSDSLGLTFDLLITTVPDLDDPPARRVADYLTARVAGPAAPPEEPLVLSILIDPRDNPEAVQPADYIEMLSLGGKNFPEVYRNVALADETGYLVYYSPVEGVVAIRNFADSLFLVLDRVE